MATVTAFNTADRTAQIVADLAHAYGYGLASIQTFQRNAIRYMQQNGCSATAAARNCVPCKQATNGECAA